MIQTIILSVFLIIGIYYLSSNDANILSKYLDNNDFNYNINDGTNNNINNNNINNNNNNNKFHNILQILVRQSARWSLAAEQDENPLIAVLHANYGAGYLWAIKDIATSEDVKKATGIDLKKFERKIVSIQDDTTKKMAKLCPKYAGDSDEFLSTIAGEG